LNRATERVAALPNACDRERARDPMHSAQWKGDGHVDDDASRDREGARDVRRDTDRALGRVDGDRREHAENEARDRRPARLGGGVATKRRGRRCLGVQGSETRVVQVLTEEPETNAGEQAGNGPAFGAEDTERRCNEETRPLQPGCSRRDRPRAVTPDELRDGEVCEPRERGQCGQRGDRKVAAP
jgi:hypothetical protein